MNNIDELIERMCPSGVPNRSLGELEDAGVIKLGRGNVISKTDLQQYPGDYPVYSSSAVGTGEFGRYGKFMFEDERITWSVDGGGKFFYRKAHRYSVTNVCGWLTVSEPNIIQTKFLYYSLINAWTKKTYNYTVKAHPSVIRVDYELPIPPLEVQREIVRILDTFTELQAELEAELEARKRQYTFYRNYLILKAASEESLTPKALGDCVLENVGGGTPSKSKESYWQGDIPWASVGDVNSCVVGISNTRQAITAEGLANSSTRIIPVGSVIVTVKINIGAMRVVEKPIAINQDIRALRLKDGVNPYFLTYFFETINVAGNGSIVKGITNAALERIQVTIPPISVQLEVVQILNSFLSLSKEIEAELIARRNQHAYYRDKLLTFKELAA